MDNKKEAIGAVIAAVAGCLLLAAAMEEEKKNNGRGRSCWIKEWRKTRKRCGNTQNLMKELNPITQDYKNFHRMDEACFKMILSAIKADIIKQNTVMREAVPPEEKLGITLRFLGSGENFMELDYNSKLSKSFLAEAILKVCDSIYKNLRREFLKFPNEKQDWVKIAADFNWKLQFSHCIGALDGKHIAFTPPKKEAPLYYNYKGFHTIVLLALADANAKFIYVDVGCNGRISDGGVLQRSDLMNIVIRQADKYLPSRKFIGNGRSLPYVFVADNAFPLLENVMTPYPFTTTEEIKKNYNRRLSRARQTVERAFGMLANRFQIIQNKINLSHHKVKRIVLCCCVLHNFLITNSIWYADGVSASETNVEDITGSSCNSNNFLNRQSKANEEVRKNWAEYFNNEGKL